jgi:hypothetical protein
MALWCVLLGGCSYTIVYGFDISGYNDPISIVRYFRYSGQHSPRLGDCDNNGQDSLPTPADWTAWQNAIANNDQALQWWQEMGMTNLYVWYEPSDYGRVNGMSMHVMTDHWPDQMFKYVESKALFTHTAYTDWYEYCDSLKNWGTITSRVRADISATEINQRVLAVDPSAGPGPFWKPGGGFSSWGGWGAREARWRDNWQVNDCVMPMHFKLTQKIEADGPNSLPTDTVAIFYWIVGITDYDRKLYGGSALAHTDVKYVRYPGIPIRLGDVGPDPRYFFSWSYSITPSAGSGQFVALGDSFNILTLPADEWWLRDGPHMFGRAAKGPGSNPVAFQIDYTGHHTYYLYSVEACDEGYYRLFRSGADTTTYQTLIASSFRNEAQASGGALKSWYIDEPNPRMLESYAKVNQILQHNDAPPFFINGHEHRNGNTGGTDSLYYYADSLGVKIPVKMEEFDIYGNWDHCNPLQNWGSITQFLHTTSATDTPYVHLTIDPNPCGTYEGVPNQFAGWMSLQATFDAHIWGEKGVLDRARNDGTPIPASWDNRYDMDLLRQTKFVHDHGSKSWALIAGGADHATTPDYVEQLRKPSGNEVKLSAWLAVACDVDGIMWYQGMSEPLWNASDTLLGNYAQGLMEWGLSASDDSPTAVGTFCNANSRFAFRTPRYYAAKKVCNDIHRIAPVLEPLRFVRTYASRAFGYNYNDFSSDSTWVGRDYLNNASPPSYVALIETRKKNSYTQQYTEWENWAASYVQVSRFMTPNVGPDDYWFLIVNRRAQDDESRQVELTVKDVLHPELEYRVDRVLADSSTLADHAPQNRRIIKVILQPGEAELVHFYPADTTDWIIDNESAVIFAPQYFHRNIVIRGNGSLTIQPNIAALRDSFLVGTTWRYRYDSVATVTFWEGKGIRFEGTSPGRHLNIVGNDSIKIRLQPANADKLWDGITVEQASSCQISLHHADIQGAKVGLSLENNDFSPFDNPWATIDHCAFSRCGTGLSMTPGVRADIDSSAFSENATGIWCSGSSLTMDGSTVTRNRVNGACLLPNADGQFTHDAFTDNGATTEIDPLHKAPGALSLYGSTARLKCCNISGNKGCGISALSSTVVMGDASYLDPLWGGNRIIDNYSGSVQISAILSTLVMINGRNLITGVANQPWIYAPRTDAQTTVTRDWRYNAWGTSVADTVHHHVPADAWIDGIIPSWSLCSFTANVDTAITPADASFGYGLHQLAKADYDSARIGFKSTISSASRTTFGQSGIQGVLTADLSASTPSVSTLYFKQLADTATFRPTKREARSAQAWSLAYAGDINGAQTVLEAMRDSSVTDTERVDAHIDLLTLELLRQNQDTADFVSAGELEAVQDSISYLIASLSKWTRYAITDSTVMYAPCRVDSTIDIAQGGTLVIKPYPGIKNATVSFAPDAYLMVEGFDWQQPRGKLYVQGEADNPVILNWDSSGNWVNLESICGYVDLKHAILQGQGWSNSNDNPNEWSTRRPIFKADSCTFRTFDEGLWCWGTDSSSYIKNSVLENMGGCGVNDPNGLGFGTGLALVDGGYLKIENCDIRNSGDVGVFSYYNDTDLCISNSIIRGSKNYGLLNWEGGNLSLECTEITDNGDSLADVWVEDGTVDLVGAHSQVSDSSGTLLYSADPSLVDLGDGENEFTLITGTGRYLKSGDTTDTWDIGMNTWSPITPADSTFYSYLWPTTPARWLVDTSLATYIGCDQAGTASFGQGNNFIIPGEEQQAGTDSRPEDSKRLSASSVVLSPSPVVSKVSGETTKAASPAGPVTKSLSSLKKRSVNRAELLRVHHEELAQWREAKAVGKRSDTQASARETMKFLADHPDSKLAPAALVNLSKLARKGDAEQTVSTFLSQQARSLVDPEQKKLAQRLSFVAKAKEGRPAEALAGLEELMETARTPRDSIQALADAMGVYFFNRHDQAVRPRNARVRSANVHELVQRVSELARILDNPALAAKGKSAAIPKEYRLYQNYPNPFNPNTEIRFDVPDAVRVELKVFNILGQEVAKLIDEVRPAGVYRLTWDSRTTSGASVASGLYVYRIKAGNFVDAKKMMLIR